MSNRTCIKFAAQGGAGVFACANFASPRFRLPDKAGSKCPLMAARAFCVGLSSLFVPLCLQAGSSTEMPAALPGRGRQKAMSKPTNWANSKDLIRAAILLLLVAALTAAPALQAQIVSFADIQSTILGSGFGSPTGVAIDGLSGTGVLPATTTVQAAGGQYSDPVKLTAVIGPSGLTFAGSLQFKV